MSICRTASADERDLSTARFFDGAASRDVAKATEGSDTFSDRMSGDMHTYFVQWGDKSLHPPSTQK